MKNIKRFFQACEVNLFLPVLYYSGHGEIGSGNWIFYRGKKDGKVVHDKVSITEMIEIIPESIEKVFIFSDACFSGHWADYCTRTRNCKLEIVASSPYCQVSLHGRFAGWLFNDKPIPHPPVFGLYDHCDEENPHKKELSIKHFMQGHEFRNGLNNTCIAFTCDDTGKYSAIFGHKKHRSSSGRWKDLKEINREWKIVLTIGEVDTEIKKKKKRWSFQEPCMDSLYWLE